MENKLKERPIIFSTDMVRAILDGRKTMTRRVIKPAWFRCLDFEEPEDVEKGLLMSPYQVGDRLWVREAWCEMVPEHRPPRFVYKADQKDQLSVDIQKEYIRAGYPYQWKPSIYMPRSVSRITLEIMDVGIERVQDISEEDCIAEGVSNEMNITWKTGDDTPRGLFGELWDHIHAKDGYDWDANPWVWVIMFSRMLSI